MNFNVNKFECIEKILREYNYDFELVRVIDDKCFSGCFIVKNKKLANRYEIIKFIDSVEKEVIDNFKSEINVLSILNHSNIPKIYDVLIDKDIVLFRCEYVNGMSLEELIKICKKKNIYLSEVFILNLILKLSDALYYTHNELKSNGQKVEIIHCDVKPSNVLVKIDEKDLKNNFNLDNLEVYLIDFGIFILQNEIRNNFVGSINYMSKWQIENKKIDWRTDVYQLTLLYLELLTNEKPFSKFSYKKIVELKKNDEINIPKNISISKINFIKKGTFTNENKKYLDEKDFLNDLNKLYIRQKVLKKFNDNKMFIKGFFLFSFCLLFFNMSYLVYDYNFNSVYSMLKIVEDNDNLSLDEL